MTDWQQPLIVALTQAEGVSTVHETVYENRLGFTQALNKMGADIVVHPEGREPRAPRGAPRLEQAAVITGPTPLHGADVVVPDLRGGYSYVIAALAGGESRARASTSSAAATRSSSTSSPPWAPTSTSWMTMPRAAPPREDPPERLLAGCGDRRAVRLIAKIEITGAETCREGLRARAEPLQRVRPADRRRRHVAAGPRAALHGEGEPVPRARARAPARDGHDPGGPRDVGRREADHRAVRGARRARSRRHRLPEGSLTRDPDLWPMRGKTGAVRLALAGIPVIPMATWGVQQILPRYGKLSLWPPRKRVRVALGPPSTSTPTAAGAHEREPRRRDRRRHGRHRGAAGGSARSRPAERWNPAVTDRTTGRLDSE
jgi:hypothetical protein